MEDGGAGGEGWEVEGSRTWMVGRELGKGSRGRGIQEPRARGVE